jgi:hypothetical protein
MSFLHASPEQRQAAAVLRELLDTLRRAPDALLQSNLKQIHVNTARLEILMIAWRTMNEKQVVRTVPTNSPQLSKNLHTERYANLHKSDLHKNEIHKLTTLIRQSSSLYAALIARARRTNNLLARATASSALTYSPPEKLRR